MTQGFYELIGARPDADIDEIKAAYSHAVAHLLRRREATQSQGGDTNALDLARAQLDDAWAVLSDAAARRRYDAMLAVAGDGLVGADLGDVWPRVVGAMIHPAVAAAARLVDAATGLHLGPLPEPPRPVAGRRVEAGVEAMLDAAREGWVDDEPPTRPGPFGPLRQRTPRAKAPLTVHEGGAREPGASLPPEPAASWFTDDDGPHSAGPRTSPPRPARASSSSVGGEEGGLGAGGLGAGGFGAGEPAARSATAPGVRATSGAASRASQGVSAADLLATHGPTGALLRAVRELRGLSLQAVHESTRISMPTLAAIEAEDFDALPSGAVFVRGYVRDIARTLGLDEQLVVEGYMRRFHLDG